MLRNPCDANSRLGNKSADFVLCDHSIKRYIEDLKLLEVREIVDPGWTRVIADLEFYPGDPGYTDSAVDIKEVREFLSAVETFQELTPPAAFANLL